ncbi:tyrosine-type recombinase/integrase [Flexivirga oryzae]|uniref:Integrase n=1 Tax=Flexivirga oryzae TaxID=1794944 RepID=A0A839N2U9_9MICO|nr:site-specific integrase [Flexivirga oryzae]MBB2891119.1 integrase [Flexivirga oryzae]
MPTKFEPGEIGQPALSPLRRDAGGKLSKLPDGRHKPDVWRARVRATALDGSPVDCSAYGATRKAAEDAVMAKAERKVNGSVSGTRWSGATLLVNAVAAWLDALEAAGDRSPGTIRLYRNASKWFSADGSPVRRLTLAQANDVQRLVVFQQWIADNHGIGTSKHTRAILSGVLDQAVSWRLLDYNAAKSVGKVKATSFARETVARDHDRALSDAEISKLLTAARTKVNTAKIARSKRRAEDMADLIVVMLGTGCRISEALSLRWEDLDASAKRLHVAGTKTDGSDRTITPGPDALVVLAERFEAAGRPTKGYVFPATDRAGRHVPSLKLDTVNVLKVLRRIFDAAGLDWMTSHTLRRTVATGMLNAGLPANRVAGYMGHSDPSMTLSTYADRDPHGDSSDLAEVLRLPVSTPVRATVRAI